MKLEETNILLFGSQWPKDKIFKPAVFFEREAPTELEIGCGKGKFLVGRAQESPEINFVGIDRVGRWMKTGDRRGKNRALDNLVFVKTDALEFLKVLEPASLDVIYMYFPDPWPKRRHRIRRLFTADFLKFIYSKLKAGGVFDLATDHEDYFQQITASIEKAGLPWAGRRQSVNERLRHPHLATNYELKFAKAGKKLNYVELTKGKEL